MHISFSPKCMPGALTVSKAGDVLTVNGEAFDLSVVPDGATLPRGAIDSEWLIGPVERIDGMLHVTLRLPHGSTPSQAVAFPEPIVVVADGPVAVPRDPDPEAESEGADHGDD